MLTDLPQMDSGALTFFPVTGVTRRILSMTKTMDVITEVIRDPKHPFRQVADQPDKPHKNRYERRKVKQYLHLGDWQQKDDDLE